MKFLLLVLALLFCAMGCESFKPVLTKSNEVDGITAYNTCAEIPGTGTRTQGIFIVTKQGRVIPLASFSGATWGKQALGAGTQIGSASVFGLFPSWNLESGYRDSGDNVNISGGGASANARAGVVAASKVTQIQVNKN